VCISFIIYVYRPTPAVGGEGIPFFGRLSDDRQHLLRVKRYLFFLVEELQ